MSFLTTSKKEERNTIENIIVGQERRLDCLAESNPSVIFIIKYK